MRVNKDIYVKYNCVITYKGGTKNRTQELNTVNVTREEYRLIVAGAAQGRSLEETEGIGDVLSRMRENVEFIDKWTNLNGSLRKSPLKKPSEIEKIDLFLTEEDLRKIRSIPDPLAMFDRPEEHMTIYRNDGSSVTISSEFGTVQITDTRNKGAIISMDADQFLSHFLY